MQIPIKFDCIPYGDWESITPLISKGRLAIYYLGKNRNYTYISEEFSEKLNRSLPYTPVVGHFNSVLQDFLGHDRDSNVAATYGLVPENPNISLEKITDEQGNERDYICCDVYIYSGRYDAAKVIMGKQQSMELNPDSIDGYWSNMDGEDYFVYTDAWFNGLCILGDDRHPCFEESRFFEKGESIIDILNKYAATKFTLIGEEKRMNDEKLQEENIVFEESGVGSAETESVEETSAENEVETEEVKTINKVEVVAEPPVENECDDNGDSKKKLEDYEAKILEYEQQLNTLQSEITILTQKLEAFETERQSKINEEKTAVLGEYEGLIATETFESIKKEMDSYATPEDLEKNLLFALKNENPTFLKTSNAPISFSSLRNDSNDKGIIGILEKHQHKN